MLRHNALAVLVVLMLPCLAVAEDLEDQVVIVPMLRRNQDMSELEPLLHDVQHAGKERGLVVLPPSEARERFDKFVGSKSLETPDADKLRSLQSLANDVYNQGFRANRSRDSSEEAINGMGELRAVIDRAPELFNTRAEKSNTLLACTAATFATQRLVGHDAAVELAGWCLYMLDIPATRSWIDPRVQALFFEADRLLEKEAAGDIRVKVTPSGCTAVLNGDPEQPPRERMPKRAHPVRRRYRVHAECPDGTKSRAHEVVPNADGAQVDIDVTFDAALRVSDRGVSLQGTSAEDVLVHLRAVAESLHVTRAIGVARSRNAVHLHYIAPGGGRIITVKDPYEYDELKKSLTSVLDLQSTAAAHRTPRGDRATKADRESRSSQSQRDSDGGGGYVARVPRWQRPLAGSALGLGVASLVVAGALTAKHHHDGTRFRNAGRELGAYSPRMEAWEHSRPQPYVFGALGAVAVTSGIVGMMFTADRAPPWWASVLSGAGAVALSSWGIADIARGSSCSSTAYDRHGCSSGQEQRDKGALLLMSATPLLTLPLMHLLDWALSDSWVPSSASLRPQYSPFQKTVFFDARVDW
jgi:hypothetical protein